MGVDADQDLIGFKIHADLEMTQAFMGQARAMLASATRWQGPAAST
jgi:hypothetical protein